MMISLMLLVCALQDDPAVPDVTDRIEHFETPIPELYGEGWDRIHRVGKSAIAYSGKQVTYDLQVYRGKIYIGHGSTNSKQKTFMLYFDPTTSTYDVDRDADGKPLKFPEECMAHMRVFEDELYVTSTDQLNGGTKFFRKNRDGTWTTKTAHKKQQHSRDLFKTGPHILVHYGMGEGNFPGVVYSPDNGKTWTVLTQTTLYDGPYMGYSTFFEFRGLCYMTRHAQRWVPLGKGKFGESRQPWIVAFTGDATSPFRAVCQVPSEFHPEILHGEPPKPEPGRRTSFRGAPPANLKGGITVGERLILSNQGTQLFAVESMEPIKARRVKVQGGPLGGDGGWRVADMLERPDSGYLLLTRSTSRGEGKDRTWTHEVRVAASTDGLQWTSVIGFKTPRRPRFLEEVDGDFYFGLFKSELLRVKRSTYAGS